MHLIHICGEASDFLIMRLHGRQFPEATDYWYANWLTCDVEVAVGAFRGTFGAVIRNEEIERALRQLGRLQKQLTGRATLETVGGWLNLDFIDNGRGRIEVDGRLCDGCNTLEFQLAPDQTDLPMTIGQLQEVCQTFPVIGRSESSSDAMADRLP